MKLPFGSNSFSWKVGREHQRAEKKNSKRSVLGQFLLFAWAGYVWGIFFWLSEVWLFPGGLLFLFKIRKSTQEVILEQWCVWSLLKSSWMCSTGVLSWSKPERINPSSLLTSPRALMVSLQQGVLLQKLRALGQPGWDKPWVAWELVTAEPDPFLMLAFYWCNSVFIKAVLHPYQRKRRIASLTSSSLSLYMRGRRELQNYTSGILRRKSIYKPYVWLNAEEKLQGLIPFPTGFCSVCPPLRDGVSCSIFLIMY